jgi:DNA-binding response OmpR family regulator
MVGPVPAREEETARLSGARGDFVGSLGRRVEALRSALRAIEQSPNDGAQRNGLLRRVHALASAARVLGFASVAEALTEAEKKLRRSEFGDVARALDLLPSLVLGVPVSLRPQPEAHAARAPSTWPLSVLVFGAQSLVDAIKAIPDTHVECERTEDLVRAREQARLFGPDLAVIDADRAGARDLVETFAKDPLVEPVPLVVIGDFASPEAASAFIALGAARVLSKPVSSETLQRTVVELRAQAAEPRTGRDPLGELSVEALADRISAEIRRGLLEAVEPSSRGTSVGFGDGADVMAAVWGAVARVRELVTLRSSGAVRFDSSGPEGAVPFAAWGNEERRAGDRGSVATDTRAGDGVSLQGRRIVVADDDPAVVWFMSGLLKAMGVEVLEAHDGARALALTYDAWPDLVVSDVLMPKLDGFSLCHEIKRDVAVRDVPVILLSWKEDLLQRVRELGASADGYLRKEAAAATVAERLREVLRPRARVEQRMVAGGDARGRLDGLTPRLILELASAGQRDVRVSIRDAVYLYEVQVRRGRLCSATRSAADGSFERGEAVLAALLGVSAGRFVVEPDITPLRGDFDGTPAEILKAPIERARRALNSISAGALVGVTRVQIAAPIIEGYLACTPEPARGLLQKIMSGASPRDLITSGSVAPRLLEAVLSDAARRGAITDIERTGSEPSPPRGSSPPALEPRAEGAILPSPVQPIASSPAPPLAAKAPETAEEDAGWFSFQLDSGAPTPVEAPKDRPASVPSPPAEQARADLPKPIAEVPRAADPLHALPFSAEVTPSVDRLWDTITEGAFNDPGTLQGVGALPDVAAAAAPRPTPTPGPASVALTRTPSPSPVVKVARSPAPAPGPGAAAVAVPRPVVAPSAKKDAEKAESGDALASALTADSPEPPRARPVGATQVMAAVSLPSDGPLGAPEESPNEPDSVPEGHVEPPRSTLTSQGEMKAAAVAARAAKTEPRPASVEVVQVPVGQAAAAKVGKRSSRGWFVKMLLAFAVSYGLVSYFKADVIDFFTGHAPSSPPASPR